MSDDKDWQSEVEAAAEEYGKSQIKEAQRCCEGCFAFATKVYEDKDAYGRRAHKAGASWQQKKSADREAKLVESLEFYANRKNWGESGADQREWYLIESTDRGDIARAALKAWRGEG